MYTRNGACWPAADSIRPSTVTRNLNALLAASSRPTNTYRGFWSVRLEGMETDELRAWRAALRDTIRRGRKPLSPEPTRRASDEGDQRLGALSISPQARLLRNQRKPFPTDLPESECPDMANLTVPPPRESPHNTLLASEQRFGESLQAWHNRMIVLSEVRPNDHHLDADRFERTLIYVFLKGIYNRPVACLTRGNRPRTLTVALRLAEDHHLTLFAADRRRDVNELIKRENTAFDDPSWCTFCERPNHATFSCPHRIESIRNGAILPSHRGSASFGLEPGYNTLNDDMMERDKARSTRSGSPFTKHIGRDDEDTTDPTNIV